MWSCKIGQAAWETGWEVKRLDCLVSAIGGGQSDIDHVVADTPSLKCIRRMQKKIRESISLIPNKAKEIHLSKSRILIR